MAEYASISLNIPKYPWKCLNKLFWLCLDSEYAWSSYMFDKLLKMPPVLNITGFWIWQNCICKGYTKFWICLNMAQYASVIPNMSQYALMSINLLEHGWILLNVPESAWKCLNKLTMPKFSIWLIILNIWQGFEYASCIKYARVLNTPQCSYNNIIIVTNVMLELLPAWFVHPGTSQLSIFFFFF